MDVCAINEKHFLLFLFLANNAFPSFILKGDLPPAAAGVAGYISNSAQTLGSGYKTMPAGTSSAVVTLIDGANVALDASLGNEFKLSAAGDRTILAPSNPTNGQIILIRHKAVSSTRTLTLTTGAGGFRFGTDLTTLTGTSSGLTDYIRAVYDSTDNRWDVIAYIKGY